MRQPAVVQLVQLADQITPPSPWAPVTQGTHRHLVPQALAQRLALGTRHRGAAQRRVTGLAVRQARVLQPGQHPGVGSVAARTRPQQIMDGTLHGTHPRAPPR
ncbi:MAG TPA: hypothetical protein VIP48_10160 [Streptosporangiaceae bacterium]